MQLRFLIALSAVLLASLVSCETTVSKVSPSLSYTVSVEDPASHYINIQLDVQNAPQDEFILRLPVWAPGYYIILDYPKNIIDFEAVATDGTSLSWSKTGKCGWSVKTAGHTALKITYKVWADQKSVAEANLEPDFLFLPGNGVFMHPQDGVGLPCDITFVPREEWKELVTGLKRTDAMSFHADNFDILYDSPFYWGNPVVERFEHEGRHYDVMVADTSCLNVPQLCSDIRSIISAATALMGGEVPYDNYAFIFMGAGQGGLEHWNSQADFLGLKPSSDMSECLSFIAHEYYHLYNVKAIHPVELGPFNYYGECYTNCLWLSEGATVFYEYYLCEKAGLISRQERLDKMARDFKVFESREGKHHMTLARSSYDIWLNFFNFAGNGGDTRVSYYEKGPAVTMLFDCAIRIISNGERSLDDVMRLLYNRYCKELQRGFTEEELNDLIVEVAHPVTGEDKALLDEVFSYIYTTKELDYNRFLHPLGLHWDAENYTITPSR